jgi:uncharacterized protein
MVGEQAPMPRASFTKPEYNDLFDSRGVVKNYKKAFPVLVFAAKLGHPHAQNLLGYCYDRGLVTRRNAKAAALRTRELFSLYRKAALMGHRWAQCNLGASYSEGAGTRTNSSAAVRWFRKAAHQGDAKAHYNLVGLCYLDGEGVRKSRRLAMRWFKEAATRGHKKAAKELRQLKATRAN